MRLPITGLHYASSGPTGRISDSIMNVAQWSVMNDPALAGTDGGARA